jgi:signal transduction histidine kinase
MVSMRREASKDPHLGLGLYIVRLITEFHGGKASAANREDGSGVVIKLLFPVAQLA